MKNNLKYIWLFFAIVILQGCVEPINSYSKIPPGAWRGVLYLTENQEFLGQEDDEFSTQQDYSGELPFIFDVIYDNSDDFHIEIRNGEERIVVKDISYGRDPQLAKDTLVMDFPVYDTKLVVIVEDHLMEGYWQVNYRDNYRINFKAKYGIDDRFPLSNQPAGFDMSGRWAAIFSQNTEDEYPSIGDFKVDDDIVTGTFLTELGDYRYLEGKVSEDKVFLSVFDGSHAFLFEGKMLGDSLIGQFYSGKHWIEPWVAYKNENASLESPYELTKRVGEEPLSLRLENSKGEFISLEDERYDDKIKLVKIMGTWCPNCKDEFDFLLDYIKNNPSEDLEILAVAFERYDDKTKNMDAIRRYIDRTKVPYEVVLGGSYRKADASNIFPQLTEVLSYPTLLFLDKENVIQKIHTGFYGPATAEYQQFKVEFDQIISELRNEK